MSIWFRQHRSPRRANLRLFCFPYAGGNAGVFDGWETALPDGVEMFAVQAPGRANRFCEPPIADLACMVDALRAEIAPFLDLPCVFFGHSNGALTAFALARALQLSDVRAVQHLIVSAKRAPHLMRDSRMLHTLADDALIAELRSLAATPAVLLDNPDAMELFLPMLRADFALAERGDLGLQPQVRARCTLFHGRSDTIEVEELLAWREYIDGQVVLQQFDGGHFFIDQRRDEVLMAVAGVLEQELQRLTLMSTARTLSEVAA
ncbi:thioesterase II family protein [Aquimonas sp.]|jgi:medium-chain acyl-[acyl-carrier-protein] hydrolase|uniref:thioesterase II family protein n=1 Tax=Aquimonas sp. TaxID=1872588 RepID=UPI0037BF9436